MVDNERELYAHSFSISHDEKNLISNITVEWGQEVSTLYVHIKGYRAGLLVVPNDYVVSFIKRLKEEETRIIHKLKPLDPIPINR